VSAFFDTNILVYAQQAGSKGERANALLAQGGLISVQVLNELTNVLRKKLRRDWPDVEAVLNDVRDAFDEALPITSATHSAALALARDHSLSFYDALIVASALEAGCDTLFSEDLQEGRSFGGLSIRNPFAEGAP
jgi:predicted nucleic acid-binding protein